MRQIMFTVEDTSLAAVEELTEQVRRLLMEELRAEVLAGETRDDFCRISLQTVAPACSPSRGTTRADGAGGEEAVIDARNRFEASGGVAEGVGQSFLVHAEVVRVGVVVRREVLLGEHPRAVVDVEDRAVEGALPRQEIEIEVTARLPSA